MELEWDEAKRRITLTERGRDFADVAAFETASERPTHHFDEEG